MPTSSLLQRLKERKLVQWALAYLAGVWVLAEAADVVGGRWNLPDTLYQGFFILLAAGFFITLVLAWYHGEKGRQRVSGPELLMITVLLVIAGTGLSLLRRTDAEPDRARPARSAHGEDERPSIAVLPFDNISPDPTDAYFADGMQDEIISRLARISALKVTSRNSTMQYREERKTTPQIAAELDVDFLLEGSARIAGDQVRLTAQLIDARRDEHLWSEDYDLELSVENLISTQSDIAQRVAQEIGARLTPEERDRIEHEPTENLEAYEALMRGVYHLKRRDNPREAYQEAIEHLQAAVEQDPDFAPARGLLAWAYAELAMWGVRDPRELWTQAEAWTESALDLDETEPSAHTVAAVLKLVHEWAWQEAEEELQRAIDLAPSETLGHVVYAMVLTAQGRIEEGLREMRILTALDPLSPSTLAMRAEWAFHSRDYEAADELLEVVLAGDPTNTTTAFFLVLSFLLGERLDLASRLVDGLAENAAARTRENPAHIALLLSLGAEADSARVLLDQAIAGSGERYVDPGYVWPTYAVLGELDQAFYWIEKAIEAQSWTTVNLGVSPLADPLRDDPRYSAILDRIGLGHLQTRFDSLAATARKPNS